MRSYPQVSVEGGAVCLCGAEALFHVKQMLPLPTHSLRIRFT